MVGSFVLLNKAHMMVDNTKKIMLKVYPKRTEL